MNLRISDEEFGDGRLGLGHLLRSFPRLIRRMRDKRAEVGLHYMLQILILDFLVPSWLFDTRDFALFQWDLDRSRPSEASGTAIRPASASDSAILCQFGRSAAEISMRFEEGASAAVFAQSGQLLGYHWVKPGPWFKLSWLVFQPAGPADIFSLDTRVHRSYRGQELAGQLRRYAAAEVRRQGYRRMYCTIDTSNRNSLQAAEKVGYQAIARLKFIRLLGLTVISVDGRRRFGFWTAHRPLSIPVASFEDAHGA